MKAPATASIDVTHKSKKKVIPLAKENVLRGRGKRSKQKRGGKNG